MHRLSEEQADHIRDGYYETHGQYITDDHLANLTSDQLRYYYAQANYFEEKDKNTTLKIWLAVTTTIIGMIVVAAAVAGYIFWSQQSQSGLRAGENNPTHQSAAGAQLEEN